MLASLEDRRLAKQLDGRALLAALPCVLSGAARSWFRMVRSELTTWRRFVPAFRDQYSIELLDLYLLAELQSRTQGKGERVSQYIACLLRSS